MCAQDRTALRSFTLVELLVVIGIIGLLAVSSMPAIRSLSRSNTISAGHRQMLDDLAYARHLAISRRHTVYMVLVPPTMRDYFDTIRHDLRTVPQQQLQQLRQLTNLVKGQFTAYALFCRRTVGDQPGSDTPFYLTPWRQLPEGIYFATNQFIDLGDQWAAKVDQLFPPQLFTIRPLPFAAFPFPSAGSVDQLRLPYIAFDPTGKVGYEQGNYPTQPDGRLTLTRGSIFYPKDRRPAFAWAYDLTAPPDVVQTPRSNRMDLRINWLTGRAQVDTNNPTEAMIQ